MDVEVAGMSGICGATHKEQHLHKPKAWSRVSVAILMCGDLAKMNVSRKGREICSSQHFQIPHRLLPCPSHLLSGSAAKCRDSLVFAGFCQSTRRHFGRAPGYFFGS